MRIARFYTLHPGDVLLTATPQGVASLERVGGMQVPVTAAKKAKAALPAAGRNGF